MKRVLFFVMFIIILFSCNRKTESQSLNSNMEAASEYLANNIEADLFVSQENNNDKLYVQIENVRFYLKYSHRNDVEAFLGQPSEITFYERGGEDFYWDNFTVCVYENELLFFNYCEEGNIIRIIVNSSYSKDVFIFGRRLNELNHDIVTLLLEQYGIEIFHNRRGFIGSSRDGSMGSIIYISFWFEDGGSKLAWFDMHYDRPWNREIVW
ncbi:MAG: hypothetical protein FWD87_09815 [Spirochaetaceae bacterium]|nr:hypothetical protein [Spirochaetaceae bacterium]